MERKSIHAAPVGFTIAVACLAVLLGACDNSSAQSVNYIVRGSDSFGTALSNPSGVAIDFTDNTLYVMDLSGPPRLFSIDLSAGAPFKLEVMLAGSPMVSPLQIAYTLANDGVNPVPTDAILIADRDGNINNKVNSAVFVHIPAHDVLPDITEVLGGAGGVTGAPFSEITGVTAAAVFSRSFFCDRDDPTGSGTVYRYLGVPGPTAVPGSIDDIASGPPLVDPYAVTSNAAGTTVYVADRGAPVLGTPAAIFGYNTAAPTPTVIVPRGAFTEIVGIDEHLGMLFFSGGTLVGGPRKIYRVPVTGGTPVPLEAFQSGAETATPHHPEQVVVGEADPGRIYTVDSIPVTGGVTPAIYWVDSGVAPPTSTPTGTPPTPTPTDTPTPIPSFTATETPEPEGEVDLFFGDIYLGEISDFDDRDPLRIHGVAGMRVSILVSPTTSIVDDEFWWLRYRLKPLCELRDPDKQILFGYGEAITWGRFRVRNYVLQKTGVYLLTVAGTGRGLDAMGGYRVLLWGRAPNLIGSTDGVFGGPGESADILLPALLDAYVYTSFTSLGGVEGTLQVYDPNGEMLDEDPIVEFDAQLSGMYVVRALSTAGSGGYRVTWIIRNPRGWRVIEE